MGLPRLRPLDIFPEQTDQGVVFHIRDHERIQENELVVHPVVYAIAAFLDGERDTAGILAELKRRFQGVAVTVEEIEQVVEELDRHHLLLSPAFEVRRAQLESEYLSRASRPPTLFDPAHPGALARLLDGFFTAEGGPGSGPGAGGPPIKGVISPHIDYFRGGPAYAHAYKALAEGSEAELFVVLGVAHLSPPSPFVLGDRGYETPFGELPCDEAFVERLRKRVSWDPREHRFAERTEHSIELQAVLLRHLVRRAVTIVPILCCNFESLADGGSPSEVEPIEEFIGALRETLAEERKEVCVISGADLAHVGPRFGDPDPVSPAMISWMEAEDRTSLDRVAAGDAEGFYRSVVADGNRRKVCGLSSIYTFLRLVGGPGRLLHYGYAPDPAGGMVSFASVAFQR
jgi:AmmeMemoRadiSam system protein B